MMQLNLLVASCLLVAVNYHVNGWLMPSSHRQSTRLQRAGTRAMIRAVRSDIAYGNRRCSVLRAKKARKIGDDGDEEEAADADAEAEGDLDEEDLEEDDYEDEDDEEEEEEEGGLELDGFVEDSKVAAGSKKTNTIKMTKKAAAEAAASIGITMAARQASRRASKKYRKQSWEERFEDDPLRSDSPTNELHAPVDKYSKTFLALSDILDAGMLMKRLQVWTHHMMWNRRNSIAAGYSDINAKVDFAYTRLTSDSMAPRSQIVGVRANCTGDLESLLASEPIFANGGCTQWSLYELQAPLDNNKEGNDDGMNIEYENITNPVRDPYLFIGTLKKGYDEEACLSFKERKAHMDYHETADCVVQMGVLKKLKGTKTGLTKTGTRKGPEQEEAEEDLYLILVNSATLKGANRYVQDDPLVKEGYLQMELKCSNTEPEKGVGVGPSGSGPSVSPMNEQDVDGLHHLMARSFAEKAELDQIHFLDPEDLLDLEFDPQLVPELDTERENTKALNSMKEQGINHRYTRFDLMDRYGSFVTDKTAKDFNTYMGTSQKFRLQPAVESATPSASANQEEEQATPAIADASAETETSTETDAP